MTAIAWDGESLAADRAAFCGDTKIEDRKLRIYEYQSEYWMYASCGGCANVMKVFEWLRHREGVPEFDFTNHEACVSCGITVNSKGLAFYVYGNGVLDPIVGPWAADGAAGPFLSGALAQGATASRALELAVLLRGDAGIGYDVLNFNDLRSFDARADFSRKANKSILKGERS